MSATLLIPTAVALAGACGAASLHRRLAPPSAARMLTFATVMSAIAVLWGLLLFVAAWLVEIDWVGGRLHWCEGVGNHGPAARIAGSVALVVAGVLFSRGLRTLARYHPLPRGKAPPNRLEVVDVGEAIAHAVPGRPGHVVVSAGILALLDPLERAALLAHEQAHLDHHHHRFVGASEAAADAVPFLRPLARLVRFATERWADEEAATRVGDRSVVAKAIIRVALAKAGSASASPTMEFTGGIVQQRVEALLEPNTSASGRSGLIAALGCAALLAVLVAASLVQMHHVAAVAHHICPV